MVRSLIAALTLRKIASYGLFALVVAMLTVLASRTPGPFSELISAVPAPVVLSFALVAVFGLATISQLYKAESGRNASKAGSPYHVPPAQGIHSDILCELTAAIANQIRTQITHAQEYSLALQDVDTEFRTPIDAAAIETSLKGLLERTIEIASQTREFKKQLIVSENKIESLSRRLAEAERESLIDPLTGIGNRRQFEKTLQEEIRKSRLNGDPLSLAIMDIDFFKQINDRFGHVVGDQVLRELAKMFGQNLRPCDIVSRHGGEEFAAIMPNTELVTAELVQTKLLASLRWRKWILANRSTEIGPITASIGVAELNAHDSMSTLIDRADQAMYQAKKNGRNHVRKQIAAPVAGMAQIA